MEIFCGKFVHTVFFFSFSDMRCDLFFDFISLFSFRIWQNFLCREKKHSLLIVTGKHYLKLLIFHKALGTHTTKAWSLRGEKLTRSSFDWHTCIYNFPYRYEMHNHTSHIFSLYFLFWNYLENGIPSFQIWAQCWDKVLKICSNSHKDMLNLDTDLSILTIDSCFNPLTTWLIWL